MEDYGIKLSIYSLQKRSKEIPSLLRSARDDCAARVAHTEREACQLVEAGYEFVCDFGGNNLFRKRK
jgi:hypothetical protein